MFKDYEFWFVVGSQFLYGPEVLDTVAARAAEMAQQMNQAAMGLQALFMLQATQNPDLAEAAQNLKVSMQDNYVTVNLQLPEEMLKKALQARLGQSQNRAAAGTEKKTARPTL